MCVIDGDQRCVVTANFFEPPRRRHQAGQTLSDGRRRQTGVEQHGRHGQQVGNVVPSEQTGFNDGAAGRRTQPEAHAAQRLFDLFGPNHARPLFTHAGLRVAQDLCRRRPLRQFAPEGVVDINYRQTQLRPTEQTLLRRCVLVHRTVVIKVVACQVCKHGDINAHRIEPSFLNADRTGLQRAGLAGVVQKTAQPTVQRRRLGAS